VKSIFCAKTDLQEKAAKTANTIGTATSRAKFLDTVWSGTDHL